MSRKLLLRLFMQAQRLVVRILMLSDDADERLFYAAMRNDEDAIARLTEEKERLGRIFVQATRRAARREDGLAGDVERN